MTGAEVADIATASLGLILTLCGPLLLAALIIGGAVGLLQALTQVQETTISFVPKLVGMGLVLVATLPLMGQAMTAYMARIAALIAGG